MDGAVVNLAEKARSIQELHAYKIVAQMNDYHFKMVKAKREFIRHRRAKTDEVFMIIEGEMVVIPKGVEHKPSCGEDCTVLLIEPAGTLNTVDAGGASTDTKLEWT